MKSRNKLIEGILPLEATSKASAREKSSLHGPIALHLWWARRLRASARTVVFTQVVDDLSENVVVVRTDPKKRPRRLALLKSWTKVWLKKREVADNANVSALPPGMARTLDGIFAKLKHKGLFDIIGDRGPSEERATLGLEA